MKSHLTICALLVAIPLVTEADAPRTEADSSPVGYATVAEALTDLRSRSDLKVINQGGWTVINDEKSHVIWSFAPSDYPAYPSVVKRTLIQTEQGINLHMDVLCEATKASCDKLVEVFRAMNDQIRASMSDH
jgi:hypothetical protein